MRWGARLRDPWTAAIVTAAVGLGATAIAFVARARRDEDVLRSALAHKAAGLARTVGERFGGPVESMDAVASLITATGEAHRDAFSRFAHDAVVREPAISALEWAPRVPRAERDSFEAAARDDGMSGYEIVDFDRDGKPTRAPDRDVYFPLRYLVPMNAARGLDLFGPDSLATRGCASGHAVASSRRHLVEDPPDVGGVLAIQPVWANGGAGCDEVSGFVVLLFHVDPVMREVVAGADLGDLDLVVRDLSSGGAVIAESAPGAAARAPADLVAREPVEFVDRRWQVEVAPRARPPWPWWLLAVGGAIALLGGAIAYGAATWLRLRRRLDQALRLGQYRIEEEIGRGGMGVVFRARHELLRRATALKLLRAPPGDAAALARFEREVRLTAELTHPNTIAIFDYGHTPDGEFYYAMEYIDGLTLQEILEHDGAQPIARAAHVIAQIAAALVEAHAIGLVHRDLKPSNLMLTTRGGIADFVKVLDFGLVKRVGADGDDVAGVLTGTPGYTAPEALRGEDVDQRADVYSVGVVWYALLTGRTPFAGANEAAIVAAQLQGDATPVGDLRALPAGLAALVMRCFARAPADRIPSARALLDALDALALPAWSAAEARAWWDERAPAVRRARHAAGGPPAPATVSIDPARLRAPQGGAY